MNEELKTKWDRLWHFYRISQQFGEWKVEMKKASEKECDSILKTQEIFTKYDVFDKPELLVKARKMKINLQKLLRNRLKI